MCRCTRTTRSNFNSRPSARGDIKSTNEWKDALISIHAPPRGATGSISESIGLASISIHAPPRGATSSSTASKVSGIFQFTPLREGRLLQPPCALVVDISIHAPPRGATKNKNAFLGGIDISIHAPPRGATALARRQRISATYFNSRPSARGDLPPSSGTPASPYFNSRPSARGDGARSSVPRQPANFNSRPSARGD